jgi:hypothetical protein
MADALHSNWTVPQVLAALPGLRRLDDGSDLLAFRVAGASPSRTVYVYLYGGTPDLVSFDLEDEAVETGEWHHAVRRGRTDSLAELREVVSGWLAGDAAEPGAAPERGGGIDLRFVVFFASLPCTMLLPFWTYEAHRCIGEPGWLGLAGAVLGMVAGVALLEGGLQFSGEFWQEEIVRKRPPGKPVPKPNLATIFWWALVIHTQLMGLGTFLTTMDGGLRWAAARWVYLGYAVPAVVLLAARWGRWTRCERLFLRWGWAPVLAAGVPVALPRLLAAGLITDPWR